MTITEFWTAVEALGYTPTETDPATVVTTATEHCSNCGTLNPEVIDSYTDCCNEPVCGGFSRREFASTDGRSATGCCFGVLPADSDWFEAAGR